MFPFPGQWRTDEVIARFFSITYLPASSELRSGHCSWRGT